jgi:hypothetical protein
LLFAAASATALIAKPSVLIYPSGPTVPENLLRIKLRFSSPLQPPLTLDQIKLTGAEGVEIKDAFLDLPLPSADGKSVAILFHPGRVKSGVDANLALGRALHAGTTIVLLVNHPALAGPIRKSWQVTAFDAKSPQPSRWTFELPQRGSRSEIVLHLDKPISSSAEHLIAIRGPNGSRIVGEAHLENGETIWRFTPARRWRKGNYAVVTHPDLEDSAGNRTCSPFEVAEASRVRDVNGTVQIFAVSK